MDNFKNKDEEDAWPEYHNPYYNPEKCGLRIIDEVHKPNLSYEFDMVILWEDFVTSKRYWQRDRGCSCPSPFENILSLNDLNDMQFTASEYERERADCLEDDQGW